MKTQHETRGRFGTFGGQYVPETVMVALEELEVAYLKLKGDATFQFEVESLLKNFVGRPTALYYAQRLTDYSGGAQIFLKREDLAHTGAHKINNAIGQALVAKYMGKTRIVAETGAGQHGVATATVCSMLGMDCVVYMGTEDMKRQEPNVFRMRLLGAEVRGVEAGSKTLKEAVSAAIRDWVTNVSETHYLIGSAVGPHPYPLMVRDFQTVIGSEARKQMLESTGGLPDYVVACVGGGSNAIGTFIPFVDDGSVQLIGVEAGGSGILSNYPGVGPEHAWLKEIERAKYVNVTDSEALRATHLLSKIEGIIPALESAHAIAYVSSNLAPSLTKDQKILVTLSGRGDKDLGTIMSLDDQDSS